MKRNDKRNGIEIIKTGSDIDLLVTAILTRTVLVCEQYSERFSEQHTKERDHEDDGLLKIRTVSNH